MKDTMFRSMKEKYSGLSAPPSTNDLQLRFIFKNLRHLGVVIIVKCFRDKHQPRNTASKQQSDLVANIST